MLSLSTNIADHFLKPNIHFPSFCRLVRWSLSLHQHCALAGTSTLITEVHNNENLCLFICCFPGVLPSTTIYGRPNTRFPLFCSNITAPRPSPTALSGVSVVSCAALTPTRPDHALPQLIMETRVWAHSCVYIGRCNVQTRYLSSAWFSSSFFISYTSSSSSPSSSSSTSSAFYFSYCFSLPHFCF